MAQKVTDELEDLGYQQLSLSTTTATALTIPTGATHADFMAEDQNIRWRNGTPTATVGMILTADANQPYLYKGGAAGLALLRFIEETGTGILNVQYYRS